MSVFLLEIYSGYEMADTREISLFDLLRSAFLNLKAYLKPEKNNIIIITCIFLWWFLLWFGNVTRYVYVYINI